MTWGEAAQMITAIAVVGSWLTSARNGLKLDEVHKTTNSLAKRNEEIARQLGVTEGIEKERSK